MCVMQEHWALRQPRCKLPDGPRSFPEAFDVLDLIIAVIEVAASAHDNPVGIPQLDKGEATVLPFGAYE